MTTDSRVPDGYEPFGDEPHGPTALVLVEVASISVAATNPGTGAVLPVHPAPRYGPHPMWVGMWYPTGTGLPHLLKRNVTPSDTVKVVVGIDHGYAPLVELLQGECDLRELTYTAFTRDALGTTPRPDGYITQLTLGELWYQTSKRQIDGDRHRSFLFGHADPHVQHVRMNLHGR